MILTPPIHHPLPFALLLFDADGTLRETVVGCQRQPRPPNLPGEWRLLPGVQEVLSLYDWAQVGCAICSNQGGVALGFMTETMARFLLQETLSEATGTPVGPRQVLMCPHAPHAGCACRKPQPLLLQRAIHQWQQAQSAREQVLYGLSEVLYVGDQESDWEAAETAGVTFAWAQDFFGWEDTPCPP